MIAVDRQIEMRDRLRRLRQPLRDHLAHVVVRHDLVGAFLEQRADLVVRRRRRERRGCGVPAGAGRAAP